MIFHPEPEGQEQRAASSTESVRDLVQDDALTAGLTTKDGRVGVENPANLHPEVLDRIKEEKDALLEALTGDSYSGPG